MRVGIIGVGRMGLPVCRNLVAAGHAVAATDERAERAREVEAAGARWVADTAALASDVDLLLTVLPGSAELVEAMSEALPALRAGSTWVDLTSSAPAATAALRERAAAQRVACLDAPMGGGIPAAETGTLVLFVGGDDDVVKRCRPVLEAFGSVRHVGGAGTGYTAKLLVNLLWFTQALAVGEAMLVAQRSGIDLDVMRSTLRGSAADSRFADGDLDALLDGDYLRSFGLDRCVEELEAIVGLADTSGLSVELARHVRDIYVRALERFGPVDGELLGVALLEEKAGTQLRHTGGVATDHA